MIVPTEISNSVIIIIIIIIMIIIIMIIIIYVLTEHLKESIDVSCLIGRGRLFHEKGAAIENA